MEEAVGQVTPLCAKKYDDELLEGLPVAKLEGDSHCTSSIYIRRQHSAVDGIDIWLTLNTFDYQVVPGTLVTINVSCLNFSMHKY